MADLIDTAVVTRASGKGAANARMAAAPQSAGLVPIEQVDLGQWQALAERAVEPNGYYLPEWELAVNASVQGRTGSLALRASRGKHLIGLLPVTSMWRAYRIPLPAL